VTELRAYLLDDHEYSEWGKLVATSPDGSIYATAEYLDTLCATAGGRFRILGVRRGDDLVGGLPLYETDTPLGRVVSPRLLLYYLGPVLKRYESKYPSQQTARSLQALGAMADVLPGLGYSKLTLKGRHTITDLRPFLQKDWSCWPSYSYVVDLSDLSIQWTRVEQNLRRLVDRCSQAKLTVTNDEDFDAFLKLHALTMSHHGAEHYLPDTEFRRWFRSLHSRGLVNLFLARLPEGQPIAGQIVLLGEHPVSHTVCAGTDPSHRSLGASAFLRWRVFESLASRGKAANDLTDAALNPVTHFKSQLGGELVTNLAFQNRGTIRWRAGTTLKSGYSALRRNAGVLVKRARYRTSE
jgi:hypothetical protein